MQASIDGGELMAMIIDLSGQDYENVKVFVMRIDPDEDY